MAVSGTQGGEEGNVKAHTSTGMRPRLPKCLELLERRAAQRAGDAGARAHRHAAGDLQVHISTIYPLSEGANAHLAIESGRTRGKLLLNPRN